MFDDDICENFKSADDLIDYNIGYSKSSRVIFVLIPTFAIIANLAVLVSFHIKRFKSKNKSQISMEKMLYIITIIETFISFSWLINGVFLHSAQNLYNKCTLCFVVSLVSIFLICLDGLFITFTIHNLRKIIMDPIEGILRPKARLKIYILISFIGATATTLISYMAKVFGRSPMMTCFIRTDFFTFGQNLNVVLFLIIPFAFVGYSVYLILSVCCNRKMLRDKQLKTLFYKYIMYITVYFIFNSPLLMLYLLTLSQSIQPDTFLSWLSYFASLMSCSVPIVITSVRLLQGYVKINWCYKENADNKHGLLSGYDSIMSEGGIERASSNDVFSWLQKKVMEEFMHEIFVGICHTLSISSINITKNEEDMMPKISAEDCMEQNEIKISNRDIIFQDESIKNSAEFEISLIEYAPKIFADLRKLENISESDMIKSLLPMNNRTSITQSQGKSGNFFLPTEDNKFILKTLNQEELYLIRGMMLERLHTHLKRYSDSIICRIYGLYKIILSDGDEVIVILMRNIIGNFNNNILCKYDLKGSSINRKTDFEFDTVNHIVMKDLNFNEIEKFLLMPKGEVERLRSASVNDAYFFNDLSVMDYSLFVVKITLSSKEVDVFFNESDSINSYEEEFKKDLKDLEPYRKHLFRSVHKNNLYIISIIDYLQTYNFFKYLETNIKYYIKTRPTKVEEISCVPPDVYCQRFIEYVKTITNFEEIGH